MWEQKKQTERRYAGMNDDAKQSQRVLANWLPFLIRAGFMRRELERLDAGHVFMLANKLVDRESEFPLTDPVQRGQLIEQTRARAQ